MNIPELLVGTDPHEYTEIDSKEVRKEKRKLFEAVWRDLEDTIHRICVLKGWIKRGHSDGEMVALLHSECSEILEGARAGNPKSDKIPKVTQMEEELADLVIRIADFAKRRNFNVAKALFLKIQYNKKRPYMHGGKKL